MGLVPAIADEIPCSYEWLGKWAHLEGFGYIANVRTVKGNSG